MFHGFCVCMSNGKINNLFLNLNKDSVYENLTCLLVKGVHIERKNSVVMMFACQTKVLLQNNS